VPVPGARERDLRNGLTIPPALGLGSVLEGARHPSWWWHLLTGPAISFESFNDRAAKPSGVMAFLAAQFDPSVTWDDIEWIRERWDGPFVLKGIQSVDDARLAVRHGVDGVVVSNHGGRQLDQGAATIELLPAVVDAVGGDTEVLVDSGIRRGSDVVKALALGARGCLVGRAFLYGLAAGGRAGVAHAIDLLDGEVRRTMQLVGARTVAELDRDHVRRRLGAAPPG